MFDYFESICFFVLYVDYFVVNVSLLNMLGLCGLQEFDKLIFLLEVVCDVVMGILVFVKIVFDFSDQEVFKIVELMVWLWLVGIVVINIMLLWEGLWSFVVMVEVVGLGGFFGFLVVV